MKILISGFEPFGDSPINPTQELTERIAGESFDGVELHTLLLPVRYDDCAAELLAEVNRLRPDAVIACGLAAGRTAITPERIAINVKDTESYADNGGCSPRDEPIRAGGPDGLFATLPVRRIVEELRAAGIPAALSNTAGAYICNNTMYALLDELRRSGADTLAGFVHFPASTKLAALKPSLPSLPQETLLDGLRLIVRATAEAVRGQVDGDRRALP
ncbi:pyroglutamyl-peptidase I [Saccharibacillus sp. CPCC 101409]|uniref:pyroglutamyl-peptidase I n=1 Tax=Saccharibacillus sp. CPCC 101409 TaxID=3058041 RepID=UPI002673320D|nr:pyroglutamyl-peptidase I [Saccharibacillus sp. CPCC 101409]MDO3410060.1 pyroglutamyl-peptidase I [Saccharibacillus sp. CPCC 101409]